jgi:hypothetical protein
MIEDLGSRTTPKPDFLTIKQDIHNAIDAYAKLYLIHKELMSITDL